MTVILFPDQTEKQERAKRVVAFRHAWLEKALSDPKVRGASLAVVVLLWSMTNAKFGMAWPSVETMADRLHLDRRNIIRAVNLLEARGWIVRTRRRKLQSGLHASNLYALVNDVKKREKSGFGLSAAQAKRVLRKAMSR